MLFFSRFNDLFCCFFGRYSYLFGCFFPVIINLLLLFRVVKEVLVLRFDGVNGPPPLLVLFCGRFDVSTTPFYNSLLLLLLACVAVIFSDITVGVIVTYIFLAFPPYY